MYKYNGQINTKFTRTNEKSKLVVLKNHQIWGLSKYGLSCRKGMTTEHYFSLQQLLHHYHYTIIKQPPTQPKIKREDIC